MYTEDENKQEKIDNGNNIVDDSYYGNYYDDNKVEPINEPKSSNKNKWFIIIIILLLLLAVLIFLLVKSGKNKDDDHIKKPEPSVVLVNESLQLKVSETKKIEYNIINDDGKIVINWLSGDDSIANVTEDGKVTALKVGVTKIIASYFINNVPHEKQCVVTVIKNNSSIGGGGNTDTPEKDNEKPTLTYSLSNGGNNEWTNKAVTINVNAKDNSGVVNVKYALDCTSNCNYQSVKNNKITIDKDGVTIVKIVVSDRNNNSREEVVNIKIDKTKPTCSLRVSETGQLTATYQDTGGSELAYYGFSSSYTGSSSNSLNVQAGTHNFYVKDKANNTNTCSLTVRNKTQYRYRDCTACNRCSSAGCESYNAWSSNYKMVCRSSGATSNSGSLKISECSYNTGGCHGSTPYYCKTYTRTCRQYRASCEVCGGCTTYGAWSGWSDTVYTSSVSRQVETKNVFTS